MPQRKTSLKKNPLTLKDFFSKNGYLSKTISNYRFRSHQYKMAVNITKAFNKNFELIIEAGTGIGKSFAYLIPALLSNKKIIVATHTKTLQEQLFKKDIPIINKLLKLPKKVVLLKGRRNYLCKYRLESILSDSPIDDKTLKSVVIWQNESTTGDISDFNEIKENDPLWQKLTISNESCLNKNCPHLQNCFVMNHKKQALTADIIVVNHSLLLSDWKLLKEKNTFLPSVDFIIIDEAHQIPDLAYDYFGEIFSSHSTKDLLQDLIDYLANNTTNTLGLENILKNFNLYLNSLQELMALKLESKGNLIIFKNNKNFQSLLENIKAELEKIFIILSSFKVTNHEIENYYLKIEEYIILIKKFLNFFINKTSNNDIYWYEVFNKNFSINITPIDISNEYQSILKKLQTPIIYTSATLTTNNSFEYFQKNLGLESNKNIISRQYKSPFNYNTQSVLYVPRNLPDPKDYNYVERLINAVLPILSKTKGRAFLLFTSYKSLNLAKEILEENEHDFNLLVQGSTNKNTILKQFLDLDQAILLGTSSFWEGVDIKGDALQCVVIDKLPFSFPSDPVIAAKIKYYRSKNQDPFKELQCPKAAISLKQGAGRLIRDFEDFGILVIGDPRIVAKDYGQVFLNSLPDMPRTRELKKVMEFLDERT